MGQRLGRYDILAQLTVGGMAELSLACTAGPGGFRKYVVLKRILPSAAEDEGFVTMFLDEARITAAFSHPNIAQVFDLGEDRRAGLFVAMEFIPGQNLNEVVDACAQQAAVMPLGFSVAVVHDCAQALHYAHTFALPTGEPSPVIHRDVAQKNIMVTYDGQVKLLDFGIAKARGALARTQVGTVKGTAGYMSPEQVRGEVVDARSDVFSLGVVLWEMITGRRLFAGKHEMEELRLILDKPIPSPDEVEPSVTPALARVTMRALERDLDRRFASARELARALQSECSELFFDQDERGAFMKQRFAAKMESTRRLFEAAAATASEGEVEAAARAYRDSQVHDRPPSAVAPVPPRGGKRSRPRLQAVAGERPPRVSARKLAVLPPPREPDTEAEGVPLVPAPREPRRALLKVATVGLVLASVALGVVGWRLLRSAAAPAPVVVPDIAAIPGADGPPAAELPVTPVEAKKPRGTGEVTLMLLPEGRVLKGKQELGRGTLMTFSLPVGTHLVEVVGADGVRRSLSLPVQPGKNKPLRLRVDELPQL